MGEIRCIYCNSKDNISVSDIIPDSITTAKCTNKNVCKLHNNLTNTLFENKFANKFAFIRNQLGYTKRNSKDIVPFEAYIYVNKKPKIRANESFKRNFTTYENFIKNDCVLDEDGKIVGLNRVNEKYKRLKDPKIYYNCPINYKELFASKTTLRTVAKICYEWHCKQNKIDGFSNRYKRITNFILNRGINPVEIVNDDFFDEHTIHTINYVQGSHALIEYKENNERFMLFTLFGIVWYKVRICVDFESDITLETIHLFQLDKEIVITRSNAVAVNINKSITESDYKFHYFIKPKSIKIKEINVSMAMSWDRKMRDLLSGVVLTYYEIKRRIKSLEDNDVLNKNIYYFYDIINYHDNSKIIILILLFNISESGYDCNKPFVENLESWVESIYKNTDALSFWKQNVIDDKFDSFISKVNDGIKIFRTIPPQ